VQLPDARHYDDEPVVQDVLRQRLVGHMPLAELLHPWGIVGVEQPQGVLVPSLAQFDESFLVHSDMLFEEEYKVREKTASNIGVYLLLTLYTAEMTEKSVLANQILRQMGIIQKPCKTETTCNSKNNGDRRK